ncbi:MAG: SDR family oxidoreductase [Lyngbya sp. HA4199-MV5]|nr:SDR family oxidoreductase [Lyngbya sp. HA4199-MV5]
MADDRLIIQDPRHQYPEPPFPRQPQPEPGLAAKMSPKPDHGEESYTGSGKLVNRKALITGGDSGIGRAVAIAYAREGADVAISYLPSEESDAQDVIALIEKAGRNAIALPGDITDEQVCRKLVTDAVHALGGLDILVNNAGKQQTQPSIGDITTEQFDQVLKTNLYALFWITQEAVPHLKPGAAIINTTSIQAYDPSESLIDYAMTKTAIVSFSKSLSKQMIEQGVRVNAVAPGPFWTALQPSGGQTQEKVEKFGSEVPLGRPGQPVEIAPIYVLLASQEASYITGEVYGATGGVGIA